MSRRFISRTAHARALASARNDLPRESRMSPQAAASAAPASAPEETGFEQLRSQEAHQRMANAIRALAMDAVEQAKSGHPGLPMGAADIATVLFGRFLKFNPHDAEWPDRDRF